MNRNQSDSDELYNEMPDLREQMEYLGGSEAGSLYNGFLKWKQTYPDDTIDDYLEALYFAKT